VTTASTTGDQDDQDDRDDRDDRDSVDGWDDRAVDADRPDVGEEVSRLTEALAGWWTSVTASSPPPPGPASSSPGADDIAADDEPHPRHETAGSCCVCPVCRVLDIARGARPDLLEKVASAAETVALLLREAAHERGGGSTDVPAPPQHAPATDPPLRGTPIDVTDGDDPSVPVDDQQEGERAWG
jgi:hypothetical protein